MTGKTALITGASRGIGAAIAALFKKNGARVLAPSRSEMDLQSNASITAYVSKLSEPVDIIVNNAGINVLGAAPDVTAENFEDVLQINLIAPLMIAGPLLSKMKERGYGRIVNISSIWGSVVREKRVTYSASKSGINGLTRSLAIELAPFNIMVNAVAPGYIDTELTRKNNSPEEIKGIEKAIPLGRLGNPDEIAEVVSFLCSEKNTYLTGQVLSVDGGYTCK